MPIPPLAPPAPDRPLPLLGGLTPERFMRRHWQKKPLLIRQAIPGFVPPLARSDLFALAAREGVESRLIAHHLGIAQVVESELTGQAGLRVALELGQRPRYVAPLREAFSPPVIILGNGMELR